MNTTTEGAYNKTGDFNEYYFSGGKNVSSIVKFIHLATNDKSLENSNEILKYLQSVKDEIINEQEPFPTNKATEKLDETNKNLTTLNTFFAFVKDQFETPGHEVDIDNEITIHFLANMQKAKDLMEFIAAYLQLYIDIEKAKLEMQEGKGILKLSIEDILIDFHVAS